MRMLHSLYPFWVSITSGDDIDVLTLTRGKKLRYDVKVERSGKREREGKSGNRHEKHDHGCF